MSRTPRARRGFRVVALLSALPMLLVAATAGERVEDQTSSVATVVQQRNCKVVTASPEVPLENIDYLLPPESYRERILAHPVTELVTLFIDAVRCEIRIGDEPGFHTEAHVAFRVPLLPDGPENPEDPPLHIDTYELWLATDDPELVELHRREGVTERNQLVYVNRLEFDLNWDKGKFELSAPPPTPSPLEITATVGHPDVGPFDLSIHEYGGPPGWMAKTGGFSMARHRIAIVLLGSVLITAAAAASVAAAPPEPPGESRLVDITLGDGAGDVLRSDGSPVYAGNDATAWMINWFDENRADFLRFIPWRTRFVRLQSPGINGGAPIDCLSNGWDTTQVTFTSRSTPAWVEALEAGVPLVPGDAVFACYTDQNNGFVVEYPGTTDAPAGECVAISREGKTTFTFTAPPTCTATISSFTRAKPSDAFTTSPVFVGPAPLHVSAQVRS